METLGELYARHDKEMKDLMLNQHASWGALNERYGAGNIPEDVYKQWDEQYGNTPLHGLRAQQMAELEAYPLNPVDVLYENVPYEQPMPEPDIFDQLAQKQQEQRGQELNEKLSAEIAARKEDDIFAELRRQQEQQEREPTGYDPER